MLSVLILPSEKCVYLGTRDGLLIEDEDIKKCDDDRRGCVTEKKEANTEGVCINSVEGR